MATPYVDENDEDEELGTVPFDSIQDEYTREKILKVVGQRLKNLAHYIRGNLENLGQEGLATIMKGDIKIEGDSVIVTITVKPNYLTRDYYNIISEIAQREQYLRSFIQQPRGLSKKRLEEKEKEEI